MKALVGAFNQEKALVGAFSVIVEPVVEPMDRFAALVCNNGQVKRLQNIAYQLGQEESKEMTRGKYLNILRKKNSS